MTKAAFCIKNEKEKNHVNIINDFLIKNEFLDKTINSFFDKNNNKTYYLINDSLLNDIDIINELSTILSKKDKIWIGDL